MRTALILAAGQSTRMKSRFAKVVHKVAGQTMIERVAAAVRSAGTERLLVVVGHREDDVRGALGTTVEYVRQLEQHGTGHAVLQTQSHFDQNSRGSDSVLVLYGDTPLLTPKTLETLWDRHERHNSAATLLTVEVDDPAGYGRIVRDHQGRIRRIVEEADAGPEERAIREINTGIACYQIGPLFAALGKVQPANRQGEYYLVDAVPLLLAAGLTVDALTGSDPGEFTGVNDRVALADAEALVRRQTAERLMREGVTIIDPANTYIDETVKIAADTIIRPFTSITGETVIGSECDLGPGAHIHDSVFGSGCRVESSTVKGSTLSDRVQIGPYSHIRPGTVLAEEVKVGNHCEVKNSRVGARSKIPHHCYVGDADIGADVNMGAGVVTVNYDGVNKHRSTIEDQAFIGCNVNLVAPVNIGRGAYVAAGSTVNKDVPEASLGIARSRQVNKDGWVRKFQGR